MGHRETPGLSDFGKTTIFTRNINYLFVAEAGGGTYKYSCPSFTYYMYNLDFKGGERDG